MKPNVRNRLLAVGALLVAGVGLGMVAWGNLGQNLVYYWTPGEMISQGTKAYHATIRLGGIVQKGSIQWDGSKTHLAFRVADSKADGATSVLVNATETPPQMFRDGIGVVVEGKFGPSQVFHSDRLMVNHSNEYRPPKDGNKPDNWKTTMADSSGAGAR